MRLLLIRHGQSEANVDGAMDTAEPGAPLSLLGRRQAAAIPAALAGDPIEVLHTSHLLRARQTGEPLARERGLVPVVDPGLAEIGAGDWEMSTDTAHARRYFEIVLDWLDGDLAGRIPGAESGQEFLDRFDSAVDRLAATGASTAALVAHGSAIRVWALLRAAGGEIGRRRDFALRNTGLVEARHDPATGWRVVAVRSEPLGGPEVAGEPNPVERLRPA